MMDFGDDDYDYGINSIDQIDALFFSEFVDLPQQTTPRNNNSSHFNATEYHHSLQNNLTFSKEGKLIVHISNISGIITSSWTFGASYECILTLDDISYSFIIPLESMNTTSTTTTPPTPSGYIFDDYIFDIFEYYGGMKLKICILKKHLFSKTILGEIEFCLHDLILTQAKSENNVNYISLTSIREQHNLSTSTLETFWGHQSHVQIGNFTTHHHNSDNHNNNHNNITINLSTRYIPIQKCVKSEINRRYYNQYKSELHHICMTGSGQIATSVIELLARKNLLKLALNCRESPDGTRGYNCLELALVSRNLPVVKVLLQRAGNLCFGGVHAASSHLPDLLTSSPYDHLGVLHTFLDLSTLLRQSTHKSSSSSTTTSSTSTSTSASTSTSSTSPPPKLSNLSFIPHSSTVDPSFFTQTKILSSSSSSSSASSSSSTLPSTKKNSIFQTQYTLTSNEILLYTGGSPVHIAVLGGSDCLQLVLTFLTKYFQVVTGWENVSTLNDMIEYTANRYDDITPFMLACLLGDDKAVKLLYDLRKPLNSTVSPLSSSTPLVSLKYTSKQTGYTPLMLACYSGNYEIVKLLLNSVELIDSQIPVAADGLNTARAANSSSRKVLEKYFQQQSAVSLLSCLPLAKDYQGRQAISIAAMCGHANVIQLLIQKGVSYITSDLNGMTPLHFGAYYGHKLVCDVIIQAEYRLTSRYEAHQQHHQRKNKYILKSIQSVGSIHNEGNISDTFPSSPPSTTSALPPPPPPLSSSFGNEDEPNPENLLKNSLSDSGEYYSYQLPTNKSQFVSPISSLNYMTRRPHALLRMDLFGNRPADIAIRRCFPEITIRLHIAVLEIYNVNHPPTYSNTINSEPLVLDLIEDKPKKGVMDSSSPYCQNGKNYHPLPTDKNGPIHSKLSSMIPLPFHFLPMKSGSNSQSIEKQNENIPGQIIPLSPLNSTNSMNINQLGGGGGVGVGVGGVVVPSNELDLITTLDQDEWTNEDEWALNAAYNFAITLNFPTPPPSPTTVQLKKITNSLGGDDNEDNEDNKDDIEDEKI